MAARTFGGCDIAIIATLLITLIASFNIKCLSFNSYICCGAEILFRTKGFTRSSIWL